MKKERPFVNRITQTMLRQINQARQYPRGDNPTRPPGQAQHRNQQKKIFFSDGMTDFRHFSAEGAIQKTASIAELSVLL